MRLEELELVCQEAARNLVARGARPLAPAVVLPLPDATKVVRLDPWPDDDAGRAALLRRFAEEVMLPAGAPCFGFVAEARAPLGDDEGDVVVVAFGARRLATRITAAPLFDATLGAFAPSETLVANALPFLRPLQDAAERAVAPDVFRPQ